MKKLNIVFILSMIMLLTGCADSVPLDQIPKMIPVGFGMDYGMG